MGAELGLGFGEGLKRQKEEEEVKYIQQETRKIRMSATYGPLETDN